MSSGISRFFKPKGGERENKKQKIEIVEIEDTPVKVKRDDAVVVVDIDNDGTPDTCEGSCNDGEVGTTQDHDAIPCRLHKGATLEKVSNTDAVESDDVPTYAVADTRTTALDLDPPESTIVDSFRVEVSNPNEQDTEPPQVPTAPASINPFAMFAASSAPESSTAAPTFQRWTAAPTSSKAKAKDDSVGATKNKPKPSKKKEAWIPMCDLEAAEQERVVQKWHSLVVDNNADSLSIPDARFHILVASRLHARCQESVVRKAMQSLLRVDSLQGSLTVSNMAAASPDDLVPALQSLQYYNVKAKHLVQAAQEIQELFRGVVPEKEQDLRKLTGIGPVMGDLLAFVNTTRVHEARRAVAVSETTQLI